jgi:heme-degrading monooxygenase HmoA
VITRVWRGATANDADGDAYEAFLRTGVLAGLQEVEGFLGATVLRRAGDGFVEFVVLTRFESLDAVRRFSGPDAEVAVIEPEARALLVEADERARHFEIAIDLA